MRNLVPPRQSIGQTARLAQPDELAQYRPLSP